MLDKKPTSRQIRAIKTRKLIYDIAVKLMDDQGFAVTTIEEISKKAGVSVGTFYHYFKSKEDIFYDLFKKADEYFESVVAPEILELAAGGASVTERIVHFFNQYAKYDKDRGLVNIIQLYNTKNELFAKKDRYMQKLLRSLVDQGQADGELTLDLSADDTAEFLLTATRGVVFDWCVHVGEYDLSERMESFVRRLLPGLKACS